MGAFYWWPCEFFFGAWFGWGPLWLSVYFSVWSSASEIWTDIFSQKHWQLLGGFSFLWKFYLFGSDDVVWFLLCITLVVSPASKDLGYICWDALHDVYSVSAEPIFFEGVVLLRGEKLMVTVTKKMWGPLWGPPLACAKIYPLNSLERFSRRSGIVTSEGLHLRI